MTFNPIVDGQPSWQRQARDHYLHEPGPPERFLSLKAARVREVPKAVAKPIIEKYEWLGTMPVGVGRCYGIFFGPYCGGVACFVVGSVGAGPNVAMAFGLPQRAMAYLTRGACVHWAPKGANSKLVAWSARQLARDTRTRLVIAFADTDAGEIGTIYQACGWTCVGRGKPNEQLIAPNGRTYDIRYMDYLKKSRGGSRAEWHREMSAKGWVRQPVNPKWKYVKVLGRDDSKLIETVKSMQVPYPKRAGSIVSDAPGDQPGEGGADPTPALSAKIDPR